MKEIIVNIAPDGKTTIETRGFAGAECLKATMGLEKALGQVTDDRRTAEYARPVEATATAQARQR